MDCAQTLLEYTIDTITTINPLHGKKLKKNIRKADEAYLRKAALFLNKYAHLLENKNKTIDYAIECYLQMLADINYESVQFMQTGEYSSKSFDEVNKRVYANPAIMEYYMHGLLLSQFLWTHHYDILTYFSRVLSKYSNNVSRYLEVGGGHGLYISEAITHLGTNVTFDLVDISQSSLDLSRLMINNNAVSFILENIFEYYPNAKYDFITMGEVLEHVEDPVMLLRKIYSLLNDRGKVFITTPTNAPTIDHIYLFKNIHDIRNVIIESEFNIEEEFSIYSEDLPPELAEKYKISMMYACILTKM